MPRQQGVPDAVVKAMAGRAGADVAQRGQDEHLHFSRGVTVEEMRQASMALMRLVPCGPAAPRKGRTAVGTNVVGTGTRMRNRMRVRPLSHQAT